MSILLDEWTNGRFGMTAAAPVRGLEVSAIQYYGGLAILIVLMLFALMKAYRMWEDIHDVEEPDSPTDLLQSFEEAHAAGEIDDEEFQRVKRRLAESPSEKVSALGADVAPDDPHSKVS